MTKNLPIGKSKFNYLSRVIKLAKLNNIKTLDEFEKFILQLREAHKTKLNKGRIKGKNNYLTYINSKEWFYLRDQYIKKFGNICQICESVKGEHLHHMTYRRLGREKDTDLLFLCTDCHYQIHRGESGIKTTKTKQMIQNLYWLRNKLGFDSLETIEVVRMNLSIRL